MVFHAQVNSHAGAGLSIAVLEILQSHRDVARGEQGEQLPPPKKISLFPPPQIISVKGHF